MAKEPSKSRPSKSLVNCEIEPEGFSVFISFSDTFGRKVVVKLHRRAANAVHALLGACDGVSEDTGAMTVSLRGELTISQTEPEHAASAI